jgi:hypothetical protein
MAAEAEVFVMGRCTGLGGDAPFSFRGDVSTTPTGRAELRQIQATADTEEAINLGGVGTPTLMVVKAVENDVYVDTSFDTTFSNELSIPEGEVSVFCPAGTPYFKNATAAETATIDIVVIG